MTKSQVETAAEKYAESKRNYQCSDCGSYYTTLSDFKAGYALAEKRIKSLEDALEFYGYLMDWDRVNNPACIQDKGKRARAVLSKLEKGADE